MTNAEIWQIVLSALNVIATILIALIIYWLQKRHEKEIERLNRKQYEEKVELVARSFVFNNNNELGYLPLCIISSNMNKSVCHKRKIYNNFNLCNEGIQKEILRQTLFLEEIIDANNWLPIALKNLLYYINKNNIWNNTTYINEDFFYKFFANYKNVKIDSNVASLENEIMIYLEKYIFDNNADQNYIPVDEKFLNIADYSDALEATNAINIIYLIKYITVIAHNIKFPPIISSFQNSDYPMCLETFEDLYYEILYWLYYTFYKEQPCDTLL